MLVRESRIKRAAAEKVVDETPVEGNLVAVKTPKTLTMVGVPANQTGFKVVRSDESVETTPKAPIIRRTRRSDQSPVLKLTFPEGTSEEDVASSMKEYGLAGYRVEQEDGTYVAIRADLKSISKDNTQDIKLSEAGLYATIARMAPVVQKTNEKTKLAITHFTFDTTKHDLESVQRWVAEKCVDGAIEEPQNPDECYVVRRSVVPEGEETRQMVLEDGITAVIVRSDVASIPDGYIAVVSEAAYGSWGWGQLDFTASMADEEFCDDMWETIDVLRNVLTNIVIYSPLPLDVRKELVNRALAQYGEYVGTVMDSLPRQLLVSVVRSATPQQQEKSMTQANSGTATPEAKPSQEVKTPTEGALTRADVQAMIDAGITAAVKAAMDVQRATPEVKTEEKKEEKPEVALTRADLTAAFAEAVKPLSARIEEVAGQTVVRSQGEQTPAAEEGKDGKKATKDVFRGAFSGLRAAKA